MNVASRTGAVGALYGPLHGGANEAVLRMLERIGSVDRIDAFLEGVKAKKEKMFGFGHRRVAPTRTSSESHGMRTVCYVEQWQKRFAEGWGMVCVLYCW